MFKEFMLASVAEILGGKVRGKGCQLVKGISINSKLVKSGDLFFALKGEHTDGHFYTKEAIDKGACGIVVERETGVENEIVVSSTLFALGRFAQYYRLQFSPSVIAITGTNGKTTVKNIIVRILGKKYKLHYTKKNFNSLIGLPLTIFELNGDEEFLVLEMGTSNPGEIARLCDIAKPTIGMITNIGPGHLEGLKSIAAIRHEKLSLLDCLPDNGFAVLGDDIDLQTKKEILKFSLRSASQINLSESGSSFTCKEKKFSTQLLGINNIYNCLGGIRLTERIGVEYELQRAAIAEVEPEPGRLAPIKINDLLIINDTYNANPVSMKAAIDFVSSLNRRKIFVLGDMLELGKDSKRLHQWVGKYVVKKCDLLLTYGRQAEYYGGRHYTHKANLIRALKAHLTGDEVILVKASRALRFEEIVNQL